MYRSIMLFTIPRNTQTALFMEEKGIGIFSKGFLLFFSLLESGIEDVVKFVKESLKSMKKSQLTTGKTKGMDVVVALTR